LILQHHIGSKTQTREREREREREAKKRRRRENWENNKTQKQNRQKGAIDKYILMS
jgi:hypothetical protein